MKFKIERKFKFKFTFTFESEGDLQYKMKYYINEKSLKY